MPSLIQGFEYDIFISYRHNDNRTGGVTEFVEHLRAELAATIKEPLSIYFDTNPHDGLLENHNVDKSLEGKLKCLIFIPIISQTYCDPKSFAWQHEFVAFNKLSKEDSLGRDIKLGNGNVASRILPVKIHDLDAEDNATIENEIGGVLRAIEFIYKEPGVNRPLASDDSNEKNLNGTRYKNQVNKVANAIKEIIVGIKSISESPKNSSEPSPPHQVKRKRGFRKANNVLIAILLVAAIIALLWYNTTSEVTTPEETDKSLVVLPFEDLSEGQDQEWFSDGLTEELLNRLSEVNQLKLISRTTSFSFKGKKISAKKIADSLGVSYILEGSVRKANDQLRITAQLIRAKDDTHLWSSNYDHQMDSIFIIQDNISQNITSALNIVLDEKERSKMLDFGTKNVKAYEEYLKGAALFRDAHLNDFNDLLVANEHFKKATTLDPKFAAPYYSHQDAFTHHLMHGSFSQQFADYSDKEILKFIADDMDAAIQFAPNSDQRLRYEMDKHVLSNNWSKLPPLINEIKARKLSPPGWGQSIFLITDPEYVITYELRQLNKDRLDQMARIWVAAGFSKMNLLDSANKILNTEYLSSANAFSLKSQIENKNGHPDKAMSLIESEIGRKSAQYTFSKMLAGQCTRQEVKNLIDSLKMGKSVIALDINLINIYHALGEYEKVDSIAHQIDAKLLGPLSLSDYFIFYGLIFHVNATPNFSARLRELGVDPAAFEKEHYFTYPPVVFKKN